MELDALVKRIDELDEIDELVDWQLSRPEPADEIYELVDDDEIDLADVVFVMRSDDGGVDVHPAILVVDVEQHESTPIVSISVCSPQFGTTSLALDHDDALRLASYLMQAAALVPPTPRHVIDLTTGDEQTGEGTA
jgi:hypothetical protein